jgi:hypothetical protein
MPDRSMQATTAAIVVTDDAHKVVEVRHLDGGCFTPGKTRWRPGAVDCERQLRSRLPMRWSCAGPELRHEDAFFSTREEAAQALWLTECAGDAIQALNWRKRLLDSAPGEVLELSPTDLSGLSRGAALAVQMLGLRFPATVVEAKDAQPWLCENGCIAFKF